MNLLQKFFVAIVPERWARSIEADSRAWMIRCSCGFERSIWDIGGIRWKARGTPGHYMRCQGCGRRSWHTTYKKPPGG